MFKTHTKKGVAGLALLASSLANSASLPIEKNQAKLEPAIPLSIEKAKQAINRKMMIRKGLARKGELLVKFKNKLSVSNMQSGITRAAGLYSSMVSMQRIGKKGKRSKLGSRAIATSRLDQWMHLILADGADENQIIARLKADPDVEIVEQNYWVTFNAIPNDPRFSELWGLNNTGQLGGTDDADVDAPEAWNTSIGKDVIVAVIDTGVDYTHPDLAENMWQNPGEIAGNNIDDDGNGYIDDVYGWDFFNNDNDPFDDVFHGTHVAGTIAAVGDNGIGVTGTAYGAKIMALKFMGSQGGPLTAAAEAIQYAAQMGAQIMNNSWGGGGFTDLIQDAISDAEDAGTLFIAAAGNDSKDNDFLPNYPSSYSNENVIAVAATDQNDKITNFSSFGRVSVDLGAPGKDILSTIPNNRYALIDGTSMATPHVSGAAAVLWSNNPSLSAMAVKQLLMGTADPLLELAGKTTTGARLNIQSALECDPSQDHMVISEPGIQSQLFRSTRFKDEPSVTLTAYLHNCTSPITRTHVVASFDNGEQSILMLDDGLHNDFAPNDGIYGGTWNPLNLGPTVVSFSALENSSNLLVTRNVTIVEDTDVDKDGLDNAVEESIGTDPFNRDTDKDQLTDGFEVCLDGDCLSYDPYPAGGDSNPFVADTDGDGFSDTQEFLFAGNIVNPKLSPWDRITISGGPIPSDADGLFTTGMVKLNDLNNDGINDFAIGQPFSRAGQFIAKPLVNGGRVIVYSGKDQSPLFEINGPSDLLGFGWNVITNGDVNDDGINDLVVSTDFDNRIGTYSIINYSGVDGSQLSRWDFTPDEAINITPFDSKDISLFSLGYDRDNDGIDDLLKDEAGSLEIISGKTGDTLFTYSNVLFSGIVSNILGDLNKDGIPEIILTNKGSGRRGEGSAFVFSGSDGATLYTYFGEAAFGLLGVATADIGDIDQDGVSDFAIGSQGAPSVPGLVTVYSGANGSPIYYFEGPEFLDWFSFPAAFDLGDDNIPDIMITAGLGSQFDDFTDNSGRIYVYRGSDGSLATEIHPSIGFLGRTAISLGDLNKDGTDEMLFGDSISAILKTSAFVMLSPPPIPTLASWKQGDGAFVFLNGDHLAGATQVTFNGVPALGFDVTNPFQVVATRPLNITTGPVCITTSVDTTCAPDDYIAPPVITSWTQQGGPFISIQGENLQQAQQVTFNGTAGPGLQVQTANSIWAMRPLTTSVTETPICVITTTGQACIGQ